MLMPASDDPKKDREIFLKILTMHDDGALQRQKGEIPVKAWRKAAPAESQDKYFGARGFQRGISDEEKEFTLAEIWEGLNEQQQQKPDEQRKRPIPDRHLFDNLPYAQRIDPCERPENVEELGRRCIGHIPRVSMPFVVEAPFPARQPG